ncbi:RNA polymerase sigma factor [Membranihabitans maritimus]|uniref:RNA polymerase sigma factor n=1 Tax=Membranihabitans maritimus TaxID=2904244 RepID=UPI001F02A7DF|nr:sigma-70 family RNA polymerase sigma factor [Membranihabitans maritimus]
MMKKNIANYRVRIYHFIYKFVKSRSLADDLTQDVMLKIWIYRDKIADLEEIDSYIMRMSKNHVLDHFKKLAKEKVYQEEIWGRMQKSENRVTSTLFTQEMESQLNDILKELPPRQQEVYTLNKKEGLSLQEIADRLDIAPNTAKNHLSRALKVIRTQMNPETLLVMGWMVVCFYN